MDLRVAGITIRVAAVAPEMTFHVDETAEAFLTSGGEPEVKIGLDWGDGTQWPGGEELFDSGSLWKLYRSGEHFHFHFASPSIGPLPYKLLILNSTFTDGEILLHRPYFADKESVNPLEYPLDELVITHHLASGSGVEMHACGIVDRSRRGCLFAGQSGAGKTTIARLWQKVRGVTILSDDRVILREKEGRIWMYGTPWHGEGRMASPEGAPLDRVFLLRQGKENTLIPLKRAAAAARLLSCAFPPYHSRPALDAVLGFLEKVVTSLPCEELVFTPDERVLRHVENEVAS